MLINVHLNSDKTHNLCNSSQIEDTIIVYNNMVYPRMSSNQDVYK